MLCEVVLDQCIICRDISDSLFCTIPFLAIYACERSYISAQTTFTRRSDYSLCTVRQVLPRQSCSPLSSILATHLPH